MKLALRIRCITWSISSGSLETGYLESQHHFAYSLFNSDVNKDQTFKAKDKDKDQTFKAKDQDKD